MESFERVSVHLSTGFGDCERVRAWIIYFYDASIATAGSSGSGVHTNHFGGRFNGLGSIK